MTPPVVSCPAGPARPGGELRTGKLTGNFAKISGIMAQAPWRLRHNTVFFGRTGNSSAETGNSDTLIGFMGTVYWNASSLSRARLDEIAQFEEANAEAIAARVDALDHAVVHQCAEDAVRRGRVQAACLREVFQPRRSRVLSEHLEQLHHSLDHLDGVPGLGLGHGLTGEFE